MGVNDIFKQAMADIYNSIGLDITIGGVPAKGYFRNEFIAVNGVESMMPTVRCLDVDVAGVTHGTAIIIDAVTYNVIGIQPLGNGATTLILSRD